MPDKVVAIDLLTERSERGREARRKVLDHFAKIGQPFRSQAIYYWRKSGGVPAARVPGVAKALQLSYHAVRPDLFPATRHRV